MNDKDKVWRRLKYVKPKLPQWGLPSTTVVMWGRSLGKTTMAMQALGRAMRELNNENK